MRNSKILQNLTPGTHIKVRRSLYWHHGIYIGSNRVVHHSGLFDNVFEGQVELISLTHFSKGCKVRVVKHKSSKLSGREIVERANSCLGNDDYCVIRNNCEHFASWCSTGKKRSRQVDRIVKTSVASGLLVLAFIGVNRMSTPCLAGENGAGS
jgi:hypothetical protein